MLAVTCLMAFQRLKQDETKSVTGKDTDRPHDVEKNLIANRLETLFGRIGCLQFQCRCANCRLPEMPVPQHQGDDAHDTDHHGHRKDP